MDLRGLLIESSKEHPLVVTVEHSKWLVKPESERVYSEKAIQFVADALAGKFKHERTGRFSPSSIGGCKRRMIFGFEGVVQLPDDIDSPDLMGLGTFGHLRWQIEGLTTEWMDDAEVWTVDHNYRVGGSIDAMMYDDSIFELKTIHPYRFRELTQIDNQPRLKDMLQAAIYSMLEGVELVSVVYEDRATGKFYEFRVGVDDKLVAMATQILEEVNNHVEDGTLPKMLPECMQKTGQEYKNCPFRVHCPAVAKAAGEL